jgi:hypothetical protein
MLPIVRVLASTLDATLIHAIHTKSVEVAPRSCNGPLYLLSPINLAVTARKTDFLEGKLVEADEDIVDAGLWENFLQGIGFECNELGEVLAGDRGPSFAFAVRL